METKKVVLTGIIAAILIAVIDFVFFFKDKIFMFLIGIAIVIGIAPLMLSLLREGKEEEEITIVFSEQSRF